MIAWITPPAQRVAFNLFGIEIMWYAVLIMIGMVLGVLLATRLAKNDGIDEDTYTSFLLWAILAAVIGARIYYVIFEWERYAAEPLRALNFREGGLAIHGGIIGGMLAGFLYARRKKLPILRMLDAAVPGLALGQAIGRWGNFFNQEAYGGPTDLPWGMWIQGVTVHPTFLYESIANALLCIFLVWYRKYRRKAAGEVVCLYFIGYGIYRFFIEGLRTDSLYMFGLRTAQIVSLLGILLGIAGWIYLRRKETGLGRENKA